MTCAAVIVAAGTGSRARRNDDKVSKQYVPIAGKAVLCHTIEAFLSSPDIDIVQVVIAVDDLTLYTDCISPLATLPDRHKLLAPTIGDKSRQGSVKNGLEALAAHNPSSVMIHDAARPFVSKEILSRCADSLEHHRACLVAMPVTDTIKRVDGAEVIVETIDRTTLRSAQTPQAFHFDFILKAHSRAAIESSQQFTDDAAIAEWAGAKVHIVAGEPTNIKLTNREDLDFAEKTMAENNMSQSTPLTDIRLGTGYDVHAFDEGDAVIIGGISIPHDRKLKGHSDADVGLHAITDAILGALADGDIGTHFPPSDPKWKGAASDLFLKDAVRRVVERGGKISNIDLTIICETPKIGPHRPAMRQAIADICDLPISRVSVKATTSERLGFTGRKEGIAALASTCIRLPETPD